MSEAPVAIAVRAPTAGPFLVDKLRALDARLGEIVPRFHILAEDGAEDGEAVHDLRVALRRTCTVLEVGRSVLGPFHAEEVRLALREVMQATGVLRDDEVLLELIATLDVSHPGVQVWLDARRRREHRLRNALRRAVRGGALERGRGLLAALLAFRVDPRRDRRLAKFARRAVDRARRQVDRRRRARPDDADALHRLRIAYKRLRYTVETFAEALPSDLAALAQPAAKLQGRLGDLHDVDVALVSVRRARGLAPEARAQVLAALAAKRETRRAAYGREVGERSETPETPETPVDQAVGADSLRKISTR